MPAIWLEPDLKSHEMYDLSGSVRASWYLSESGFPVDIQITTCREIGTDGYLQLAAEAANHLRHLLCNI
ncbi:MAG: hypothetical protein WDM89_19210 [Rhizomicrobium sp.]